jgi:hypothetical protein
MADFEAVKPSYDITSGTNWTQLLKFWGINIVVSVVVTLMIFAILYIFIGGGVMIVTKTSGNSLGGLLGGTLYGSLAAVIPVVLAVLMGQMYALSWFEEWDGCYKKKQK